MTHVKNGATSVMFVAAKLMQQGYIVSFPATEDAKYDMIVDANGKLYRIQIKTIYTANKHIYPFMSFTSKNDRIHERRYNPSQLDYFIGYHPATRDIYIFPVAQFCDRTRLTINTATSKYKEAYHLMPL